MFFVRSGRANSDGAKPLGYSGQGNYYWSSTPNSNGYYAYYLYFGNGGVLPSNSLNRYYGSSLRCLAS